MADIIISKYKDTPVVTAFIGNKMEYLSFVRESDIHNIYVGRVDHIVKNIDAAFVKYTVDNIGYLPLKNITSACVLNKDFRKGDKLCNGDIVLVQVESEAVKTKKTKLTTNLSIPSKYSVITLGKTGIGASVKLPNDIREMYTESVKDGYNKLLEDRKASLFGCDIGLIIRTEALDLGDEVRAEEVIKYSEEVTDLLCDILKQSRTRTQYSLIYSAQNSDVDSHVNKATAFLKGRGISDINIIEDSGIYGIPSKIEELCRNKVWLKSGAFLIIEQLESFNAIDVNTGKAIKGDDIAKSVNNEAAVEIMRQIRLRNLTGMILIDFINMEDEDEKQKLIDKMKHLCKQDPIHTAFIDITGLGIMELIRNKNDKSLKEILKDVEKAVDNSKHQC
ncbi:hypothetical protein D6853_03920 [Butyrivibrio sp. X503]|uniref:ribonuclease E/G n=1 Tax=Butyrivibrio sp. X503 TaxID=2364878 RepID=UPI000EA8BF25|nr:ribonuclease E/G [Butyrivibrio sp. X503]RKM57172.1 hypothetical protein D6853_03920 [Butyrivibrio sp. X503]